MFLCFKSIQKYRFFITDMTLDEKTNLSCLYRPWSDDSTTSDFSVADPDPRSDMWCFFTSWIQDSDPGWTFYGSEIRDPDPGLIILLTVKTCTWTIRSTKKVSFYFSSFFSCRIRDPGYKKKIIIRIRDPEWKFLDPDPQHCLRCSSAWGETF
jgi:hypothetical protein